VDIVEGNDLARLDGTLERRLAQQADRHVIRMLGQLDRLTAELEAADATLDQLARLHGALGDGGNPEGRLGRVVEQHAAAAEHAAYGLAHF
ncbi:hypothetical protein Q2426_26255, partial [Escherichia coli]|nr:hypothetical protein [Escherichia coli]